MDSKEQQISVEIGARLKEYRRHQGKTQQMFADDLNSFDRSNLSKIERGERSVDADFLYYLLKHYPSIRLEWLILGHGTMEK